jgi:hypothetical protein
MAIVLAAGFGMTGASAAITPETDPVNIIWRRPKGQPAWIFPAFSRVSASFRRPVATQPRVAGAPAASMG